MAVHLSCTEELSQGLQASVWVLDPNGQPYQYCKDARTFAVQPGEFSVRVCLEETVPDFKQKWGITHIKALTCDVYVDGIWMDSKWVKGSPYEHTFRSKVIQTPKGVEQDYKMVFVKPEASGAVGSAAHEAIGTIKIHVVQCRTDSPHAKTGEAIPTQTTIEGRPEDKKFFKQQGVVFSVGEATNASLKKRMTRQCVENGLACCLDLRYDMKEYLQLRGVMVKPEAAQAAQHSIRVSSSTSAPPEVVDLTAGNVNGSAASGVIDLTG